MKKHRWLQPRFCPHGLVPGRKDTGSRLMALQWGGSGSPVVCGFISPGTTRGQQVGLVETQVPLGSRTGRSKVPGPGPPCTLETPPPQGRLGTPVALCSPLPLGMASTCLLTNQTAAQVTTQMVPPLSPRHSQRPRNLRFTQHGPRRLFLIPADGSQHTFYFWASLLDLLCRSAVKSGFNFMLNISAKKRNPLCHLSQ